MLPARKRVPKRRSGRQRWPGHIRQNLALWQKQAKSYDRRFRTVLGGAKAASWGLWRIPESKLGAIGDPRGQDILEIGCGAARWSIALARRGGRAVGLDLTPAQLAHAVRNVHASRLHLPLVRGDAERLPFADASFDVVFCDWGALTFTDPYRSVPEAARVLRQGGRLVFATSSPFRAVTQDRRSDRMRRTLAYNYFGLHRIEYRDDEVNFVLPYGEWIRLFTENGLTVVALHETQPAPREHSRYLRRSEEAWARRWPLESIWVTRRVGRIHPRAGRRTRAASHRRRL